MNFLLFSNCCFVYMARKGLKIPKGYIRIRKSMKDRQYTDQMKKDKRPKSDLQNTTQKTRSNNSNLTKQPRCELRCSEGVSSSFSTCDTRLIAPFTNPVRSPE